MTKRLENQYNQCLFDVNRRNSIQDDKISHCMTETVEISAFLCLTFGRFFVEAKFSCLLKIRRVTFDGQRKVLLQTSDVRFQRR